MVKKRVGCLYRVSTKKQGEKNDIPMQRISCNEFIDKKGDWTLEKEYIELGISGYKISESKRDVLQDIKKDVINKKIDILLVFMFDRIGRKEEETPFVVEWLIKQNIEVWSVNEGQQRIENRVDKLMNYLTYWQAGGESEKTSIRVKEKQLQMAEDGVLTYGGSRNAPYGYDFVKSGTYTKKGVERQKLVINSEEAKIVEQIFNLYMKHGYGIGRIAKSLNKQNIRPRRGNRWSTSSIATILKNPIYMGYPAYNKKTTQNVVTRKELPFEEWILPKVKREDLAIILEEQWYKTQEIRKSKTKSIDNNNDADIINYNIPKQTKSKLLFIGLIKCGECGSSFMTSENKKKKKNGEIYCYWYYRCSSARVTDNCGLSKKCIRKETIETPILNVIYSFLNTIESIDLTKAVKDGIVNNNSNEENILRKCEQKLNDNEKNIKALKNEVIKSLAGESNFSSELLNELIEAKEKEKIKLLTEKSNIEKNIAQKTLNNKELLDFKHLIPIWKEEFEEADIEIKKMLIAEIIKEIRVYNSKIEIDLRLKSNNYLNDTFIKNVNSKVSVETYKIIENTICIDRNN